MATIIDYGQQFRLNLIDLEYLLSHSEVGPIKSNGSQATCGILINGMFARHAELVVNVHSEAYGLIHKAARQA